jgi:rubrerythrin
MNTETNAALTAINQAIELEVKGQRFYLKAAECTINPKGAEMFRSLADDEVIHERILRRQLDALTQGEGWVPVLSAVEGEVEGLPEDVAEIAADLTDLFPAVEKVCAEAVRPDDSDLDALLFGLQIEKESFELYRELAQATEDPNGKRMYEYLAGAERGHFEQLMLNYEYLSTTGSWAP